MKQFKLKQRVKYIGEENGIIYTGDVGTIVNNDNNYPELIGVAWDKATNGHDCEKKCKFGRGFFVQRKEVKILNTSMRELLE